MLDNQDFLSELAEKGVNVLGVALRPQAEGGGYFVYVGVTRDRANKQRPSNLFLKDIREALHKRGVSIEFLLSDDKGRNVESGLRATLLHHFGDYVRNVYASLSPAGVDVWVEPKQDLDSVRQEIENKAAHFLSEFNLKVSSLALTVNNNLPSSLVCLQVLRKIAPVGLEPLTQALKAKDFTVPSDDWLKRRLESMRKKGLVVWLEGNRYALTHEALQKLGTIKGRRSPDIERFLAIAKGQG